MRRLWPVMVAGALASVAAGTSLRTPGIDPKAEAFAAERAYALALGHSRRIAAAAARSESAAARIGSVQARTEALGVESRRQGQELEGMLGAVARVAESAAAASSSASRALDATTALDATVVDSARQLAVEGMEKLVASSFQERTLSSDPYEKAQRAGVSAVRPYDREISILHDKANRKLLEAKSLASRSQSLAADAQAAAKEAQAKLRAGNAERAKADEAFAKVLQAQAMDLAAGSRMAQDAAVEMQQKANQYLGARQEAATKAARDVTQ
mmetsp:Transcript_17853/g.39145  ORF Transcript_17853/g.39145 Transcript_17853/m.39145 type:complete len:271 (+) Transcript_17853:94-906(+)